MLARRASGRSRGPCRIAPGRELRALSRQGILFVFSLRESPDVFFVREREREREGERGRERERVRVCVCVCVFTYTRRAKRITAIYHSESLSISLYHYKCMVHTYPGVLPVELHKEQSGQPLYTTLYLSISLYMYGAHISRCIARRITKRAKRTTARPTASSNLTMSMAFGLFP